MVVSVFWVSGCAPPSPPADLVLSGGRVWTGNTEQPWAQAVAVSGDSIVFVGSNRVANRFVGAETEVVDASGKMVLPGFIDSHIHFLGGGFGLSSVQLRDADSPEEFIRRIGEFAKTVEPGVWITGGSWDHERWGGELPRRDWIDSVTPNNPVLVSRLDGHMALGNTVALDAAGIDRRMETPEGGTIVRNRDGSMTGIFKDNAGEKIFAAVPEPPEGEKQRALRVAMEFVSAQGVTMVHHVGTWDDLGVFERAYRSGGLSTRVYAAVPLSSWERLRDKVAVDGRGDDWLKLGALKGYVDGSLGSHTAAFFEPFSDVPADSGFFVSAVDDLFRWALGADSSGLQLLVHAIGDRAISTQLDIFASVARENGPRDRRFRIEHAQHVAPSDFLRFAALDVIASVQPYHAIDDGRWAERVIGTERIQTTYAFRSFIDAGGRLAFGSDWSVAPPTPLEGIYAAVTRRTLDGANPDGWVPEQKITVEEALRAYTIDAAYAAFGEERLGSLEVGKLADLVIVDRDLTTIPPQQIRDAAVVTTIVGGRVVFSNTP